MIKEQIRMLGQKSGLRVLLAGTVTSLVVFGGAFALTSSEAQSGPVSAKSDRLSVINEAVCDGQTWGAWSKECLDEITERSVRTIGTVTIENRDTQNNVSVLVRKPV
ncbi:MAG: hypothetical protein ABJN26_02495 [Stappiaceae bacterium]